MASPHMQYGKLHKISWSFLTPGGDTLKKRGRVRVAGRGAGADAREVARARVACAYAQGEPRMRGGGRRREGEAESLAKDHPGAAAFALPCVAWARDAWAGAPGVCACVWERATTLCAQGRDAGAGGHGRRSRASQPDARRAWRVAILALLQHRRARKSRRSLAAQRVDGSTNKSMNDFALARGSSTHARARSGRT